VVVERVGCGEDYVDHVLSSTRNQAGKKLELVLGWLTPKVRLTGGAYPEVDVQSLVRHLAVRMDVSR
jgi:hypothetical protein